MLNYNDTKETLINLSPKSYGSPKNKDYIT